MTCNLPVRRVHESMRVTALLTTGLGLTPMRSRSLMTCAVAVLEGEVLAAPVPLLLCRPPDPTPVMDRGNEDEDTSSAPGLGLRLLSAPGSPPAAKSSSRSRSNSSPSRSTKLDSFCSNFVHLFKHKN